MTSPEGVGFKHYNKLLISIEIDEIRIYSTTVKLMIQSKAHIINQTSLNIECLKSGMYLIQISQKSGSSTFKFIVQ